MKEIHLTKKDFKVEWYSGEGAGGQHRNKHQNCCRIIHIATGLRSSGTESRSRVENQRKAFRRLATLIISYNTENQTKDRRHNVEVIRNYHAVRNEVLDKKSRFRQSYNDVVVDGDISKMIEARRRACLQLRPGQVK